MRFLLDTNVISELGRSAARADPRVRAWGQAQVTSALYLSAITVLELDVGVRRMERRDATQGSALRAWLEQDVLGAFAGRILPVDVPVAQRAAAMHVPDPQPDRDALIAATADQHGLSVATRNVADFARLGVTVVNPWT